MEVQCFAAKNRFAFFLRFSTQIFHRVAKTWQAMEGSFFFKLMIAAGKGGRQEDQSPLWHFLSEQGKKFREREKISLGGEKI